MLDGKNFGLSTHAYPENMPHLLSNTTLFIEDSTCIHI